MEIDRDTVIPTPRLDLVSLSPAFIRASLAGRRYEAERLLGVVLPVHWPGDSMHVMQLRLEQLERDPAVQPWLLRAMALRGAQPACVGAIGFHLAPSADGKVEVGYRVESEYRRRGFAEEAVRSLFAWARRRGIREFVASVGPDNQPSLRLVRKLGFQQTGSQMDEIDGLEWVFSLDASRVPIIPAPEAAVSPRDDVVAAAHIEP